MLIFIPNISKNHEKHEKLTWKIQNIRKISKQKCTSCQFEGFFPPKTSTFLNFELFLCYPFYKAYYQTGVQGQGRNISTIRETYSNIKIRTPERRNGWLFTDSSAS